MKKTILALFLLVSSIVAQIGLERFVGEQLSYDVMFNDMKVAEINTSVGLVDDSTMEIKFVCKTIGWAEFLFDEKDSIYTKLNYRSGQLINSYRLADWNGILITNDITEVFIAKSGNQMTYRYKDTDDNEIVIDDTIMVNTNLLPIDLQEIVTSSMLMRLAKAEIGQVYYLNILGMTDYQLLPKLIPLTIDSRDTLYIEGNEYQVLRTSLPINETKTIFEDPVIWVTDDIYHLPLQGELTVNLGWFGKAVPRIIFVPSRSTVPYWQKSKEQLLK